MLIRLHPAWTMLPSVGWLEEDMDLNGPGYVQDIQWNLTPLEEDLDLNPPSVQDRAWEGMSRAQVSTSMPRLDAEPGPDVSHVDSQDIRNARRHLRLTRISASTSRAEADRAAAEVRESRMVARQSAATRDAARRQAQEARAEVREARADARRARATASEWSTLIPLTRGS